MQMITGKIRFLADILRIYCLIDVLIVPPVNNKYNAKSFKPQLYGALYNKTMANMEKMEYNILAYKNKGRKNERLYC